ncbi:RRP15-like protein [Acropora millepora]|uniref:RRP15-like protein n=1 Tax=Acropora millepora TaxID=45264 RepID=UPI001CF52767|nr:RRP15-like protein [Acropora millepora]
MAVLAASPDVTRVAENSTLSELDENMKTADNIERVNEGWADAMARILFKNIPEGKPAVLAKCKEIDKRKAEIKEEKVLKKLKSEERQVVYEKGRVKPTGSTLDYEKTLAGIATRGVVKLFNAVSKHQKEMESRLKEAPTEAKKSKVVESMSKSAFLSMLKSSSEKPKSKDQPNMKASDVTSVESAPSTWNILRDDFMMGAKMRDWNRDEQQKQKEGEDENLTNVTEESESDDESHLEED